MRAAVLAFAFLGPNMAVVQPAPVNHYPPCRVEAENAIPFKDATSRDDVVVRIVGDPCYEATLTIEIHDSGGALLYQYKAPFKRHVATSWEDPLLSEDAQKLALTIVSLEHPKFTDQLPAWLPKDQYYDKYSEAIEVSRVKYNSLRTQKRLVFTHPTRYEEWVSVYFDIEDKVAKIVLKGGV